MRVQQLLCGESGLASTVLCKGSDHVKIKGQSLTALQNCPMQGVRQPSKIAPGSSGGGQALYKAKTWRGERRWKAVPCSCHNTVINVSEADLTIRAEKSSQRHFLRTA